MSDSAPETRAALSEVRDAPTILDAVHAIEEVIEAARREGPMATNVLARAVEGPDDPIARLAAVYAAVAAGPDVADKLVVPLLTGSSEHLREHAAAALAGGEPVEAGVAPLAALADEGGFAGTLAEATLERWAGTGSRGEGRTGPVPDRSGAGLTVAQLYLHGEIDSSLRHAGRGDTGGIATLLVRLGDALLGEPQIHRVLTLSRESQREDSDQISPEDLAQASDDPAGDCDGPAGECEGPGHHYLGIPVPRPAPPASRSWTLRRTALAGLRDQLAAAGVVDVLHLRMADVGSWAGAQVARELGIPVVLTLAPDPHALLAARESDGTLTRDGFVEADLAEHLVFRIRLLRELADQAAALVTFPRPELDRDLHALLRVDPAREVHVVPEGIDVETLVATDRHVAACLEGGVDGAVPTSVTSALAELDALLESLPAHRRDLPVVLSVGRLHPVKGMATLARAWAEHHDLAERCNLVIVGGDLRRPTSDETDQLALLDEVVARADGPHRGLLLAGHRSNATVAAWLAAVRRGRPGLSAPGGVYACASLKEEFGIALCEALGSGLVVVAPDGGGPPTYIEQGVTGVLTDTVDPAALGAAVTTALAMAASPDAEARAAYARSVVTDRFSITTMAGALAPVYAAVAR